jgi:aminoglycoside 6'-N-acetyltransferase I
MRKHGRSGAASRSEAPVDRATRVRMGVSADTDAVSQHFFALWPDRPIAEHREETFAILSGKPVSTLPLVVFVAEVGRKVVGFVEVGLRSHADGCDASRPVGFIEGWYVEPEHRRRGVGRALIRAAEDWARSHGCREMASDTWFDNKPSQQAHEALGFEVVDRCVNYKKALKVAS